MERADGRWEIREAGEEMVEEEEEEDEEQNFSSS